MNYSNPQRYKNGDGARFESERVSIKQQKERLILLKKYYQYYWLWQLR